MVAPSCFICKFLLGIIPNKENMERRNTVQREIVLKAIHNLKNHPTAEDPGTIEME